MKINVHTTDKEPEDIAPFTMIPALVWKAYDGEITPEMLITFSVLSRHVNPHEGIGRASYAKICTWLQIDANKQHINRVNKVMTSLRNEHKLIWFPGHSGSRGFQYVVANYKLAKRPDKGGDRWIDIGQYFEKSGLDHDRGHAEGPFIARAETKPNEPPPEQRLERYKNPSFTKLGDHFRDRLSRPPYTNNDN